jgi:hypothetical protein
MVKHTTEPHGLGKGCTERDIILINKQLRMKKITSVRPVLVSGEGSNLLLVPGRAFANSLRAALM